MLLIPIAQFLGRHWYRLTAYFPRLLPTTPDQYERFKAVLVHAFDVPDEPQIWVAVAGQIVSHDGKSRRKPWGHIANVAHSLQRMNLAMGHKHQALHELNLKLAEAMQRDSERLKQEQANAEKEKALIPASDGKPVVEGAQENASAQPG